MIECFIAFFGGWMIGARIRELRIKRESEQLAQSLAAEAAVNFANKQLSKYDNSVMKAVWHGQKEYLRIMIRTAESGVSVQDMKKIFEVQMDLVEQELAVENTKELLL